MNNGSSHFGREPYVQNLINAKNSIVETEEKLEAHISTTEFLQDCLKDINQSV